MNLKQKKKIIEKMLDSLKDKAVLNTCPGRIIRQKYIRPTTKTRRHDGRKYPRLLYPQMLLEDAGVFTDWEWDNWTEYRDGFRDRSRMWKYPCCFYWEEHLIDWVELRKKIKRQIKIRKARKITALLKNHNKI